MTIQQPDPNRLHLRRLGNSATYFIVWRQRRIGQVQAVPIITKEGSIRPPILLEKHFSEQLVERIKDLVNNVMGTNQDFIVRVPPRRDHPSIQKYLLRQLKW